MRTPSHLKEALQDYLETDAPASSFRVYHDREEKAKQGD